MKNHFYAIISRMKNIYRWGLMRNTRQESLSEHSLEVAYFAHALAIIKNKRFGGNLDPNKAAVAAMFHDTSEIITGDMPTPIKYYNPEIKKVYKEIEAVAEKQLTNMLPDDMKEEFTEIYNPDKQISLIVKAADKLSAYVKCLEEIKMGNKEFEEAAKSIKSTLEQNTLPEVKVFMEEFIPSFSLSLDEQRKL